VARARPAPGDLANLHAHLAGRPSLRVQPAHTDPCTAALGEQARLQRRLHLRSQRGAWVAGISGGQREPQQRCRQ